MMKWSAFIWLVLVIAVAALQVKAAPAPRGEDSMFRELLKLDQMYSSIARPSLRSDPTLDEMRPKVQRAMLRLQELDRMYADRARPRFGKRTDSHSKLSPSTEYDEQYPSEDFNDWVPSRR